MGDTDTPGVCMSKTMNEIPSCFEAFGSVRAFGQVVAVYKRLSALELPVKARERYRRLVERLGEEQQDAPRPVPV